VEVGSLFTLLRRHGVSGWLLAVVLLVLATGGAAWAAHRYLVTSTKQISPKVLAQLRGGKGKPGSPGDTGPAGSQGTTGNAGPAGAQGLIGATGPAGLPGSTGSTGPAGSALAYAYVQSNGTLVTSLTSSNITQSEITNPSTGFYCINSLPFTPHVIAVTIGSQMGSTLIASGLTSFNGNCTGTQAHVVIETPGGVLTDSDFMITIN
jgi:hypothetical protein